MNDDSPDVSQELSAVLEDVRRHLLWQEDGAGRMLMIDAKAAAELQRLAPSLRSRFTRPGGAAEPTAASPERRLGPSQGAPPPLAERRSDSSQSPPVTTPPAAPSLAERRPALTQATPATPPVGAPPPMAERRAGPPAGPLDSSRATPSGPMARPPTEAPAAPLAPLSRPAAPASTGMLLDVPRSSPGGTTALPGSVDGERPTLDQVRRELGDCRRCKLCTGRKNIVFGTGNPRAELVFVGEGPGENEDLQGVPFVGAAGDLLTKMIEAMGFRRDDIYICNVVKCRPPGNRNPEPDEIAACEPFLRAQLAAIQPKVVVALGKFAAQTLLRDSTPITRMRGAWRVYEGIQLMPTFHPAYLLRNPAEKRKAWEDLQAVMKIFGKNPGSRA
ncbi:uracil-DNA glycosylase [Myxococcus eversor]|uniref:uracil-DNA glycosylase n=1 Tax=Myxococcus eversor TaxID=2709661 RepID=UPI001F07C5EB|nr:uracil-DNA glycosylase [Myxococcus eversor]